MTSSAQFLRHGAEGLSHLVEAATALTALVESQEDCNAEKVVWKAVVSDDEGRAGKGTQKAMKKREIFPEKLMEILSDASLTGIVSWLPHGRSFVIMRPDLFTDQVLPKYLPPVDARSSTKYPSFTRKLNRWGFRQATRGPDTGAFHHPFFRRDQADLCIQMVCQKSRESQVSRRRTLPPKKRIVSHNPDMSDEQGSSTQVVSDSSNATSVSTDDRSVTSLANSASSTAGTDTLARNPPLSVVSEKVHVGHLPFISNDPKFVAETLRERDASEVLKVARAMLYEAYMNAVKSEDR